MLISHYYIFTLSDSLKNKQEILSITMWRKIWKRNTEDWINLNVAAHKE